jgi:CDP-diacylglycerol--glycerol-3-phosphate 3-phosphatidyltransferase
LLLILGGAFLAGLGVPYVLEAVLVVLSVFGAITVTQRVLQVRRLARAAARASVA